MLASTYIADSAYTNRGSQWLHDLLASIGLAEASAPLPALSQWRRGAR